MGDGYVPDEVKRRLYDAAVALLPNDATADYSYLEFFGDKDTILEASVFLARKYPGATIAR